MRRRWVLSGTAGVVVAAAVTVAGVSAEPDRASAASSPPATDTAAVERTTLLLQEDVDGTLGYGSVSPVGTDLAGKVTSLAEHGTVVERGQTLYGIAGRQVVLLYGDVPFWRTLERGVHDGPDVRVLEQNLVALGHGDQLDGEPDDDFDWRTARAVRAWQEAQGLERTGTLSLGTAVVAPGAVRVAERTAHLGATVQPGAPVLGVTGTTPVVGIDLDARKAASVEAGDPAEITLPDGRAAAGTVESVSTVAVVQEEGSQDSGRRTVSVFVRFDDPADRGGLDGAPVEVTITRGQKADVLAVPVQALLALAGGGYGVEVVEGDGSRSMVPVEIGTFAQGKVEVSGDGLAAGTKVTVPS